MDFFRQWVWCLGLESTYCKNFFFYMEQKTQEEHINTPMSRLEFEITVPVFEQSEVLCTSNSTFNVIIFMYQYFKPYLRMDLVFANTGAKTWHYCPLVI
jgi:hypothetical protein